MDVNKSYLKIFLQSDVNILVTGCRASICFPDHIMRFCGKPVNHEEKPSLSGKKTKHLQANMLPPARYFIN